MVTGSGGRVLCTCLICSFSFSLALTPFLPHFTCFDTQAPRIAHTVGQEFRQSATHAIQQLYKNLENCLQSLLVKILYIS